MRYEKEERNNLLEHYQNINSSNDWGCCNCFCCVLTYFKGNIYLLLIYLYFKMEKILRKTFIVNIAFPKKLLFLKYKKNIKLEIKQASIMETLQYFDLVKNPEDIPFGFIIILEKIY